MTGPDPGSPPDPAGLSYRAAGVDVAAGEHAVQLLRERAGAATRPEVLAGIGGFAGLFALPSGRYRQPVLAASTDGVGTKLVLARLLDRHDTVGIDLVAMIVDDIVVCGAEPLFVTDYLACGKLDPDRVATIVGGVAEGCRQAGAALLGGETAEHPGVLAADEYDLAGAGVGIVEAERILGADRVRAGDAVVALAASGLHANGYSLARAALLARAGMRLDEPVPDLGGQLLGAELLVPTRIYAPLCLAAAERSAVHAYAHVTGGGLAANLARSLPEGLTAVVDRSSWAPHPVFGLIRRAGRVPAEEMEATFNQGVGMVALVDADSAQDVLDTAAAFAVPAWVAGEVRRRSQGDRPVRLVGEHPAGSG